MSHRGHKHDQRWIGRVGDYDGSNPVLFLYNGTGVSAMKSLLEKQLAGDPRNPWLIKNSIAFKYPDCKVGSSSMINDGIAITIGI